MTLQAELGQHLLSGSACSDENKPIELSEVQLDQVTAGGLILTNGNEVFANFDRWIRQVLHGNSAKKGKEGNGIMKSTIRLAILTLLGLGMAGQTASAAELVHAYELDGDFLDDFGGPVIVPNGGTISAAGYTFGANQGLSLTNGLVDSSDYSIVMVFEHDLLSPTWRKLVDFQQLAQDFGLYVNTDRLAFWTLAVGGGPDMIAANTDVQVVLTRDSATNTARGYLNGVLQWASADPSGQAVSASNVLTFFEDDFETGRHEAQSGSVGCIAIHDGALSDAEVADVASRPGCGTAPILSCVGFEPPMEDYPVRVRGKRALPLKAQLFDADGFEITDLFDLTAPPVVQVHYDSGNGDAVDVSGDALPVGLGDDGNQFVYIGEAKWQYNLKTLNYTAPGTYTVTMDSGDVAEYVINPTCVTEFVIY